MKAQDVMTRKVWTAVTTTPVQKLAQMMISRRVSALPVIDSKRRVLGIVSEADLLRRTEVGTVRRPTWWSALLGDPRDEARAYVRSRGRLARDVMSHPVISVSPTADVADIVDIMQKWPIKRVPVTKGGKLVGIVSRSDLLRVIARAKPRRAAKLSDADLRQRLQDRLNANSWAAGTLVNFVVDSGKVELFGLASNQDQRDAIRVLAETTTGVRAVADHLSLTPPQAFYS